MSQSFTITLEDGKTITYESLPSCSVGDYSGDGTVGRANIDSLCEEFDWEYASSDILRDSSCSIMFEREAKRLVEGGLPTLIVVTCMFGYEELFMRTDHERFEETYKTLEDYAVYDDSAHSEQEREDKEQNWESWLRSDFIDVIRDHGPFDEAEFEQFEAEFDALSSSSQLSTVERWLCSMFNIYIEHEAHQGYILSCSWDRFKDEVDFLDKDNVWSMLRS